MGVRGTMCHLQHAASSLAEGSVPCCMLSSALPGSDLPPWHCRRMQRRLLPGRGCPGSPRVRGQGLPVPAELQQRLSGKVGLFLQGSHVHCHQLIPILDVAGASNYTY